MSAYISSKLDSYLVLVPRGLHEVAAEWLQQALHPNWQVETSFWGETDVPNLEDLPSANRRDPSIFGDHVVGAFSQDRANDWSVGYNVKGQPVWTRNGQAHQSAWIRLDTTAPPSEIQKLRGPGIFLAWATGFKDMNLSIHEPLEAVATRVIKVLQQPDYSSHLGEAVNLWRRHQVTRNSNSSSAQASDICSEARVTSTNIKFRISCWRSHSKSYPYPRQDFIASVANSLLTPLSVDWQVDLDNYDLELVVFMRHESQLAVGISFYSGRKAFSTGQLPPDLTPPYLDAFQGLVRLRPNTAQLLLHMAAVKPGEVLLDPCAGVGTIPAEVPRGVVSLGGDLALPQLESVVTDYRRAAVGHVPKGADALVAWDASLLPIRTATVDCIVSDLPFGHQCLNTSQLQNFLPPLCAEMARVLRPSTGRVVLLCGHYRHVLQAMKYVQENVQPPSKDGSGDAVGLWRFPCTAVIPCTIGGTLAWVVKLSRSETMWSSSNNSRQFEGRIRKLTGKRNRIAQLHKRGKAGKAKKAQA